MVPGVYFPQVRDGRPSSTSPTARLFQLILSHSGWRYAEVAAGETFLDQQGLQNALWTLGGVPEVVRSDNTWGLIPTASKSPSTTAAWWPMLGCSFRSRWPSTWTWAMRRGGRTRATRC